MTVVAGKREVGRIVSQAEDTPEETLTLYVMQVSLFPGTMVIFRAEARAVSVQANNMGDLKRLAIPLWADTLE